jgi:hypothetical protein
MKTKFLTFDLILNKLWSTLLEILIYLIMEKSKRINL